LRFSSAEAINIGGGALEIRAADGVKPVLQVEVRRQTPFLATKADTPIKLVGVTIEVRYVDPGPEPAAVIEAGSHVTLDRCAFVLDASAATPGSSAVKLAGGVLTATGCSFENFDSALDLSCFGTSTSTLRQCLFVSTAPAPPPEPDGSVGGGWAVWLRSMPGIFAKSGRKLVVDHCTVKGRGVVAFEGFSADAPMNIRLNACAALADSLISWIHDPECKDKSPTRDAMIWTGQGNQYEIRGKAWVLVAPRGSPLAPMPDGPVDFETWKRKLATEQSPIPPPIRFATEASSLSAHPTSAEFVVAGEPGKTPGADPVLVGPGAKALKP